MSSIEEVKRQGSFRNREQPARIAPASTLESINQFMHQIRPYRVSITEGRARRNWRSPKPQARKRSRPSPAAPTEEAKANSVIQAVEGDQPCAELLLTETGIEAQEADYLVPFSSPNMPFEEAVTTRYSTTPQENRSETGQSGQLELDQIHVSRLIQEENHTGNSLMNQNEEISVALQDEGPDFQLSLSPRPPREMGQQKPSHEQNEVERVTERQTEVSNRQERLQNCAKESPEKTPEATPKNEDSEKGKGKSHCASFMELLFKYGDCRTRVWLWLGVMAAVIAGVTVPSIAIVYGEIVPFFDPQNGDQHSVKSQANALVTLVSVLCAIQFVFGYFQFALLQAAAERIVQNLEKSYLKGLFAQKCHFFEGHQTETLPNELAQHLQMIRLGIGEKLGQLVFTVSMFLGGLGIALWTGPLFTAICLCYVLLWIGVIAFLNYLVKVRFSEECVFTEQLGVHAREVMRAFRIVVSNSKEDLMAQKFEEIASNTFDRAIKASSLKSVTQGFFVTFWVSFFVLCYAVGGWLIQAQAVNPATGEPYKTQEIVIVGQAVMISCLTFMSAMTSGTVCTIDPSIVKAAFAGKNLAAIIDKAHRRVREKPQKGTHAKLLVDGGIRFENVIFRSPVAAKHLPPTLQGLSFFIRPNTLTAITGSSSFGGQSSIGQLLARLYTPDSGTILFNNLDLNQINMATLRDSVVYVPSKPALFNGTIRDNLLLGNTNANEQSIREVLEQVNLDVFGHKLDTQVSNDERYAPSTSLTDGQKYLVSVARALLRKPQVLILDDTESFADQEREHHMQTTLSRIKARVLPRTTVIVITNKAQTVKKADNLVYIASADQAIEARKREEAFDRIVRKLDKAKHYIVDRHTEKETMQAAKTGGKQMQTLEEWLDKYEKEKSRGSKLKKGWKRVLSYHPRGCSYLMVLFATISALAFPTFGYIVANIQLALIRSDHDNTWAGELSRLTQLFLVLSMVMGVLAGIKKLMFGTVAENLVLSLRCELFRSILSQKVRWLDGKDQDLTSVLTQDVLSLSGMTMETFAVAFEVILSLIVAVVISTLISPQITLYAVVFSPIILLGVFLIRTLQFRSLTSNSGKEIAGDQMLLTDSILNFKTVLGLNQGGIDELVCRIQADQVQKRKQRIRQAHLYGLCFGYSNCARMLYLGLVFWMATLQVQEGNQESSESIYTALWVLFSTLHGASIAIQNLTSLTRAKEKANTVFTIIDSAETHSEKEKPQQKKKAVTSLRSGSIEFKSVTYTYPGMNTPSLNRFSMKIPLFQRVAIVDLTEPSDRGTITDLLLRFYETAPSVNKGVKIDGVDITDYDLRQLRKQVGYISRNSPLFNQTVKCNLLFGDTKASDEKILKVAIKTNLLPALENGFQNELDAATETEKTMIELRNVVAKRLPGVSRKFVENFQDLTDKQSRLLLEVLRNADEVAMRLIEQAPEDLVNQLVVDSEVYGTLWEDVILNFEWLYEFMEILRSDNFDLDIKKVVESAAMSHRYLFNFRMIQEWDQTREKQQPLQDYIQANRHVCAFLRDKRLTQLQDSIVKTFRDPKSGEVRLGSGFEKSCGHKGRNLCTSQRQRVAIARALLKDPKIIIYEEDSTPLVDQASLELVQVALDRAMDGRTSIILATRLSTISKCDHVYVMKRGQIVESGTYEQLVTDSESYFCRLKNQLAS